MGATRPKRIATPKEASPPSKRPARGLPGSDRERAEQRREFAKKHRETLRRLGK
jgi:death on curing protein